MGSQLPQWVQVASALLTLLIAAIVTYIAFMQWRTAQAKLALDLFEKRIAVYDLVREAISIINTHGKVDETADRKLLEAMNASEFLFGDDIREYLEAMWKKFSKMRVAQSQLENSDEKIRKKAVSNKYDLFREITQFYYEGGDVFAHYMRIDHKLRAPLKKRRRRPQSEAL